jgi:hypothetical protein
MDNSKHTHDIIKKCQFCEKENCQRFIKEYKSILPTLTETYTCLIDTKQSSEEYPKDYWKEAYEYISENIGASCGVDGGFPCTSCIKKRIKKLLSDEKELVEIKEKLKKQREIALKIMEENEKRYTDWVDPDSIKTEEAESSHPYLCFQHGGGPDGQENNIKNGFKCPECEKIEKYVENEEEFTHCDKCQKVVKKTDRIHVPAFVARNPGKELVELDICDNCIDELSKWFGLKKEDNNEKS